MSGGRPAVAGQVSVVMPNRDHAHYLPKAIDALLGQTWPNLEVLVVDDASNDDSRALVESYARRDSRVRLLPLDLHRGIHHAVQFGVGEATGEFVYIAAADDFVESAFFQRCVEELERFPTAGLCFSDPSEFYREPDRTISYPLSLADKPVYFDASALTALFARNYFHISPNTGIYRLSAFRAAGGYVHEFDWLSDWFVTTVVALRHGACYLPEQLTHVAIRPDSYSAQARFDHKRRRAALHQVLHRLAQPEYHDVFNRLRQAAILPEYQIATLLWLWQDQHGRQLITTPLLRRTLLLSAWSLMRQRVPAKWRRRLRRSASRRNQADLTI